MDLESVGSLLPVLAYGDLEEQDWCSLSAGDCIHFILLAQQGLQLLLQEVAIVHDSLVSFDMFGSGGPKQARGILR